MNVRLKITLATALALAAASVAALVAATPAAAAAHCRAGKPTHIAFHRHTGKRAGYLTWRSPRHATPGLRYRVVRGHAVIGETARRRIRVSVVLKRSYRFTVVPARSSGLERGCAASRRVHVAYRMPSRPGKLRIAGRGSTRRATWRRSRPGDGGLAGYRVKRNGATLGQTRHTAERVHVSPGHTYRFVVVAVDKQGHVSGPSNVVKIRTKGNGKRPQAPRGKPTAPTGVQAGALSDSQIAVSWSPSSERGGHITGYRVLRNGAVVHQVSGTSTTLTGLRASTTYAISVVAVDSAGAVSAPSATVNVTTKNPTPSTGHAQAFILASTDQSYVDFEQHYQQVGVIYPTYYTCNGAGALEGTNNILWTKWAQARAVRVLPRINCQNSSVVNDILTNSAMRTQWLNQLVQLVDSNGYDGLNIDFESGPATDRAALTSFISELAQRLHAQGKLLSMCLSATTNGSPTASRSGIFDYTALSHAVDYPLVMAWGLHWATSAPGSQDDITWVRQVLSYVASLPDHAKFIAGFNLYAMDWPDGGGAAHPAATYEYSVALARLAQYGASATRDAASDSMTAGYTDAQGATHVVWFENAATEADRIQLAQTDGLGGVAFWRLGTEDQSLWSDPLLAPGAGF
ncbi:MAG TPA: glycosyl hydrolase family 18 protein [Solirubrobacteraceae bacterium]|nr:glycosyl hydrolase family 18 protein [Solirubrobacteraceae bacterium]